MSVPCPLCGSQQTAFFTEAAKERVSYSICNQCDLVFLDPRFHLSSQEEKARYLTHENTIENSGYVKFLDRLKGPMLPFLTDGSEGLDYGCGPGPVLAEMFRRDGFRMEVYDPFFADDMAAFSKKYSFVTCTEVVEHFNNPAQEFTKLAELLLPQGILGLMTEERPSAVDAFASWYYRRDPSHVSFYSDKTMNWIAQKWELSLVHRGANVWIFRKDD